MAVRRSSSSKTVMRIDRVEGIMNEPPTPISTRAAMRCQGSGREHGQGGARAEDHQAEDQGLAAAVAVGEDPAVSNSPAKTRM